MSVDARAVRTALLAIGNQAREMRETGKLSKEELASLIWSYLKARDDFTRIMNREKVTLDLRFLPPMSESKVYNTDALKANLRDIEIECLKGAEALAGIITTIPKEDLDKLKSLREELKTVSAKLNDTNYEKNITQAIDEYEAGHMLASVLISSRVVICALDKISGKEAEDKVKFLDEKKIIDKKRKDTGEFILKANKKARNFFSHDIKAFPDSSDAISLLGDTIAILRIIMKLEEASKS